MRIEYVVAMEEGRWTVRRGYTRPLSFSTRDQALAAAEKLARAASATGDKAVVAETGPRVSPQALRFF